MSRYGESDYLTQPKYLRVCMYECLSTCAALPGVAPVFADRAQRVFSSGPARSLAGPAVPARNTALSGCIPQASGQTAIQEETNRPWIQQRSNSDFFQYQSH